MIIYNVTIQISWYIHEEWLQWIKEIHIPEILATGLFTHHRLVKLLEVDDTDGPTYAVQYFTTSLTYYYHFIENHSRALQQKETEKWGDKFVSFGTIMEVVDEL